MKKYLLSSVLVGVGILIIGFIVSSVFGLFIPGFQDFYLTDVFIQMDGARFLLFLVHPFAIGFALAWLYEIVHKQYRTPLKFAGIYFAVSAVPMFFINVGSLNVPVSLVVSWVLSSYLYGLFAGFVNGKIMK